MIRRDPNPSREPDESGGTRVMRSGSPHLPMDGRHSGLQTCAVPLKLSFLPAWQPVAPRKAEGARCELGREGTFSCYPAGIESWARTGQPFISQHKETLSQLHEDQARSPQTLGHNISGNIRGLLEESFGLVSDGGGGGAGIGKTRPGEGKAHHGSKEEAVMMGETRRAEISQYGGAGRWLRG